MRNVPLIVIVYPEIKSTGARQATSHSDLAQPRKMHALSSQISESPCSRVPMISEAPALAPESPTLPLLPPTPSTPSATTSSATTPVPKRLPCTPSTMTQSTLTPTPTQRPLKPRSRRLYGATRASSARPASRVLRRVCRRLACRHLASCAVAVAVAADAPMLPTRLVVMCLLCCCCRDLPSTGVVSCCR